MPFFYLAWSYFSGTASPANPWNAAGLEWRTTSPPPTLNFASPPVVTEEPYNYPDALTTLEPNPRDVAAVGAPSGPTPNRDRESP
jgi:cytochrome c oxidase subunit 1